MNQLIVITFDGIDTAKHVRQALADASKQGVVKITDAAVIFKEADGTVKVDNEVSGAMWAGLGIGGLLGLALTFVFPIAGIALGMAGGAAIAGMSGDHIDKKFVEDVRNELKPGSSALFILEKGNEAALRGVLEPFEGNLYQTTLDSDAEQQLRDALK